MSSNPKFNQILHDALQKQDAKGDDLLARLRVCKDDCYGPCPMRYEEPVEQDLFRVCCAAQDAADLIEKLQRDARRWELEAEAMKTDRDYYLRQNRKMVSAALASLSKHTKGEKEDAEP